MQFIFCMNLLKFRLLINKTFILTLLEDRCAIYQIGFKLDKIYISSLVKNIYLI